MSGRFPHVGRLQHLTLSRRPVVGPGVRRLGPGAAGMLAAVFAVAADEGHVARCVPAEQSPAFMLRGPGQGSASVNSTTEPARSGTGSIQGPGSVRGLKAVGVWVVCCCGCWLSRFEGLSGSCENAWWWAGLLG